MDRFAGYLMDANHLKGGVPVANRQLSFQSADRYFSAVKVALIERCGQLNTTNHIVCNDKLMKGIRDGLRKHFVKKSLKEGKSLSKSHETASSNDITSIAMLCIWSNDSKLAMFWSYLLTLIQAFGRGQEAAAIKYKAITMHSPPEFGDSVMQIAKLDVPRFKTLGSQEIAIFNHSENFLFDFYFGLGYNMVMNDKRPNSDGYIFPEFADKLAAGNRASSNDPDEDGPDEMEEMLETNKGTYRWQGTCEFTFSNTFQANKCPDSSRN